MKIKISLKDFIIIGVIAAIIIFCIVAIHFGVMPFDIFPSNFSGAILGALIGSLITVLLLIAQSNAEEQKGKDIKILERKIESFKDFIKDVWNIWSAQKISIEQFQDITSNYYKNLMIYLNKKRIETIGNYLSNVGECINKPEKSSELRKKIVLIINELSSELELGGKIDTTIMDKHEKLIFPLLFKNMLQETLSNKLSKEYDLDEGNYEYFKEGGYNLYCLCFNFIKFEGCKIYIGPLIKPNHLQFALLIDMKHQNIKDFRASGTYCQRIEKAGINFSNNFMLIDFENEESLEHYRKNSMDILRFTEKVYDHFSTVKIDNLNIIEFLEKYITQNKV